MSKELTWDELAEIYDKTNSGRPARTLSMDAIFKWAEQQPKKFKVNKEGVLTKLK